MSAVAAVFFFFRASSGICRRQAPPKKTKRHHHFLLFLGHCLQQQQSGWWCDIERRHVWSPEDNPRACRARGAPARCGDPSGTLAKVLKINLSSNSTHMFCAPHLTGHLHLIK